MFICAYSFVLFLLDNLLVVNVCIYIYIHIYLLTLAILLIFGGEKMHLIDFSSIILTFFRSLELFINDSKIEG